MTSSILRIILTSCVASWICCCLPMSVSNTCCSFMSLVPLSMQSMPSHGLLSVTCRVLISASVLIGSRPEFSASASGTSSSASAKARMAYCSMPVTLSASSTMASAQLTSALPPPYTILLSLIRLRATHIASCRLRFTSSTSMWLPPRTKTVTAPVLAQPSTTSMRSLVVPKATSRTTPARPSLSAVSSLKRGMMRALVAIASSSSSTPPTQRTAGSLFCNNKWLASSSKPHWQMTRLAPLSLTLATMSRKYSASCATSFL
mmetsp:Transcript_60703/g.167903  ORF Transcript_60703/g.167903 Transcript_60703/m.167903 type:complete len:261 (-) Transcript_60703:834-1616(-)